MRRPDKMNSSIVFRALRKEMLTPDTQCATCAEPAAHLHHRTYDNCPNERREDLVALCTKCHSGVHQWQPPEPAFSLLNPANVSAKILLDHINAIGRAEFGEAWK